MELLIGCVLLGFGLALIQAANVVLGARYKEKRRDKMLNG
jgi:hypothetical protein